MYCKYSKVHYIMCVPFIYCLNGFFGSMQYNSDVNIIHFLTLTKDTFKCISSEIYELFHVSWKGLCLYHYCFHMHLLLDLT